MFGGFYFLHFLIQHDLTLAWLDIFGGLLKLRYKVLTYDFDLINRHIYTISTNLLQPWNTYLVYFLPIDSIPAWINDVSKEYRKERMFDGQISAMWQCVCSRVMRWLAGVQACVYCLNSPTSRTVPWSPLALRVSGLRYSLKRRLSECSRRFHNHGEGPY